MRLEIEFPSERARWQAPRVRTPPAPLLPTRRHELSYASSNHNHVTPKYLLFIPVLHRSPFTPPKRHSDSFSQVDAVRHAQHEGAPRFELVDHFLEKSLRRIVPVLHAVEASNHVKIPFDALQAITN